MPIYEYECRSCGHELEKLQKLNDPLLTECPVCHQQTLTKLISAVGFQLKGAGWYETDFKNKKGTNKEPEGKNDKSAKKAKAVATVENKGTKNPAPSK